MTADVRVEILAVEQLALLLHKSPASIRSDASRNPEALPPICRLPGTKRLLFRHVDVMEWLAHHVERRDTLEKVNQPIANEIRKRGRPRKTLPNSTDSFVGRQSHTAGGRK
jgi:hypothetical protein